MFSVQNLYFEKPIYFHIEGEPYQIIYLVQCITQISVMEKNKYEQCDNSYYQNFWN